jgi:hypothetical protein
VKSKTEERYEVIEIATELVVFSSLEYKEAQSYYMSLKNGSGFAGFTPPFILNEHHVSVLNNLLQSAEI